MKRAIFIASLLTLVTLNLFIKLDVSYGFCRPGLFLFGFGASRISPLAAVTLLVHNRKYSCGWQFQLSDWPRASVPRVVNQTPIKWTAKNLSVPP